MCLYMCINVDGRKEKKKIERLRDVEDIFFDLVCFTKKIKIRTVSKIFYKNKYYTNHMMKILHTDI